MANQQSLLVVVALRSPRAKRIPALLIQFCNTRTNSAAECTAQNTSIGQHSPLSSFYIQARIFKHRLCMALLAICIACPVHAQQQITVAQEFGSEPAILFDTPGRESIKTRARGCNGGKAAATGTFAAIVLLLIFPFAGAVVLGAAAGGTACLLDNGPG